MIEIVCYDNDRQVLNLQTKAEADSMEMDSFSENVENIVPTIGQELSLGEVEEPPVIVVGLEDGELLLTLFVLLLKLETTTFCSTGHWFNQSFSVLVHYRANTDVVNYSASIYRNK